MDESKRQKLIEIDYEIRECCALCKHSDLRTQDEWGTCQVQRYQHQKHTVSGRQLSVNRHGWCVKFEPDKVALARLGRFEEFLIRE
jgi:hypothetical protein